MQNSNQTEMSGTIAADGAFYNYRYRIMSVKHLPELQADIEAIRQAGQLSDSEIFQGYLRGMKFALPETFAEAQSIVVLAVFKKPMKANVQFADAQISAFMPPNYYDAGLTRKMLVDEIQQNIIQAAGYRVEMAGEFFHLKLLAVRSGLGRYGRNNICYVDGLGSFISLHAYLTDYRFETDSWTDQQMMELCQQCRVCLKQCPGGAIREDNFVIDIKRCITLYNEVEGVFPAWIPAEAHNAFMGCMKCQAPCPANRELLQHIGQLESLTEEETRQFVNGNPEAHVIRSVSQKLKLPYLVDYPQEVGVISRNIRALRPQA